MCPACGLQILVTKQSAPLCNRRLTCVLGVHLKLLRSKYNCFLSSNSGHEICHHVGQLYIVVLERKISGVLHKEVILHRVVSSLKQTSIVTNVILMRPTALVCDRHACLS